MKVEELEDQDIYNISITKNEKGLIIDFKFTWNEDYGLFSKTKSSDLTVLTSEELWDTIQKDIKHKQGIVYQYILNHKLYVGELLDFYNKKY